MFNILEQFSNDLAEKISGAQRSVVQILVGKGALGAGTIWHADGLIVTNAHVIGKRNLQVILPDGRAQGAKLLAYDANHDIAALKIDAQNLPIIPIGESRALKPGELVFAVGHPWGVIGAVTSGIVIGSGAALPEMARGRDLIAVNLRYRPGYSGGPLVNAEGQMVGINTLMTGPEVGAAVPVHIVKAFLRELRETARVDAREYVTV